jgi:hypothetical protein
MMTKIILLFIIVCGLSLQGFSKNNDPKQEDKKATKTKYDFTIFRLFSINQPHQTDSTTITLTKTPLKKED